MNNRELASEIVQTIETCWENDDAGFLAIENILDEYMPENACTGEEENV